MYFSFRVTKTTLTKRVRNWAPERPSWCCSYFSTHLCVRISSHISLFFLTAIDKGVSQISVDWTMMNCTVTRDMVWEMSHRFPFTHLAHGKSASLSISAEKNTTTEKVVILHQRTNWRGQPFPLIFNAAVLLLLPLFSQKLCAGRRLRWMRMRKCTRTTITTTRKLSAPPSYLLYDLSLC